MHLTGVILDIYDDPTASVLRQKLAGRPLPEDLGNSDLLGPEQLQALPDRLFGLVAVNGHDVVRKFAMHDPAHVTTSILYFLETGHLLPPAVQKVAAQNLLAGCAEYGLTPPEQLEKVAFDPIGGVLGLMDAKSKVEGSVRDGRATMDSFRAAQAGATSDMQRQQPRMSKEADLNGTEMMPMAGPVSTWPHSKGTARGASASAGSKRASWQHAGDLTAHHPVQKTAAMTTKYAMPSQQRYPIDSYSDVKTAAAYFDEHVSNFRLEDRREFAVSLAARMEELAMPLTDNIAKYAGHEYGPNIDVELAARVRNYEGTGHEDAYGVLLEKRAATPPHVMLEMIHELDVLSGAAQKYDSPLGFRDPFQAVYGKVAAEVKPWSWSEGNEYVTDTQLKDLAVNRYPALDRAFGMDMRKSFQQDPIGVFTSMPDPQKIVLARLAADGSNS